MNYSDEFIDEEYNALDETMVEMDLLDLGQDNNQETFNQSFAIEATDEEREDDSEDDSSGDDNDGSGNDVSGQITAEYIPVLMTEFANDIALRDSRPATTVALILMLLIGAILNRRIGLYPKQKDFSYKLSSAFSLIVVTDDRCEHPARLEFLLRHLGFSFNTILKNTFKEVGVTVDKRREIAKGKIKLLKENVSGSVEGIYTPVNLQRSKDVVDDGQVLLTAVRNAGLKELEGRNKDLSLLTRFVVTRPPRLKRALTDIPVHEDVIRAMTELLININKIRETFAEFTDKEIYLHFSEDAQEIYNEFLVEIENQLEALSGEDEALLAYLDSLRDLLPRFALILYIAERVSQHKKVTVNHRVSARATRRARRWCTLLGNQARDVFALLLADNKAEELIMKKALNRNLDGSLGKEFSARDIYRRNWAGLESSKPVKRALLSLVQQSQLVMRVVPPQRVGGRSTILYQLAEHLRPVPDAEFGKIQQLVEQADSEERGED